MTDSIPLQQLTILLQDHFIERALQLWLTTHLMISHTKPWHLQFQSSNIPLLNPIQHSGTYLPSSDLPELDEPTSPDSRHLLILQLTAALEHQAKAHYQQLAGDLERKLLVRSQSFQEYKFRIFLVTVLFLNCAERMSWHFQRYSKYEPPQSQLSVEDYFRSLNTSAAWSIDKPPSYYQAQGEHFARVLCMLVRMRAVPPKTKEDGEGIIRKLDGMGDEGDREVADWFDKVKVSVHELAEAANRAWDENDARCWDLKWIGRLLDPRQQMGQ